MRAGNRACFKRYVLLCFKSLCGKFACLNDCTVNCVIRVVRPNVALLIMGCFNFRAVMVLRGERFFV